MKWVLIGAALAFGGEAAAQDLRYNSDDSVTCVAKAGTLEDQRACIGLSAGSCMNATSDGGTTVGMGYCLDQERAYWDSRLNNAYRSIRARTEAWDGELDDLGSAAPRTGPALRDMQRTWITYRDATCGFEMSLWGGGTGGGPAIVGCLMRLTGEQTLYLEQAWIGE